MESKEIIQNILEVYNINATEFADKIEVQRSGISHIITGRNKPSLDFLMKVKNTFPDLRWDFLIYGKLPMFEYEEMELNTPRPKRNLNEINSKEKYENLNLFEQIDKKEKHTSEITTSKKIKKIVIFYTDGSFEAYRENNPTNN